MARILLRPSAPRPTAATDPHGPRPAAGDDGLVLVEDFESLPVGPLALDGTAAGEHHFLEPRSYRGRWVEGTVEHDGRPAGWTVVEYCGNHVLELSEHRENGAPIPVVGDPDWTDLTVGVRVRRLARCRAGLCVRFTDGRAHYRVLLDGDRVRLMGRLAEQTTVLAEAGGVAADGEWHELLAELTDDVIVVRLDGREVLRVRDRAFASGCVGLFADGPAQFDDLKATVPEAVRRAAVQTRELQARQRDALREALPRPRLWRMINVESFGAGRCVRWGDLDGDGRYEMLLVQAQNRFGRPAVGCVTAVDLEGNVLWRFGEPARTPPAELPTADLPVQIHDLDGDGFDEVLLVRESVIHVLDGRTGEPKAAAPAPETPAGPLLRAVGTGLFFADLSGRLRCGEVLLTDGRRVWAFANDLTPLWNRELADTRSVLPADIDGDGREEVFVGAAVLDAEGRDLWSIPADDVRSVALVRGAGEPRIAVAAGADGFLLLDRQGRTLVEDRDFFLHGLSAARFRSDLVGMQVWAQGRRQSPGALMLLDADGRRLAGRTVQPAPAALSPVNWTGEPVELLLLSVHPEHGGLLDASGRTLVEFPKDGQPTLCCRALPLSPDGRDGIACWDAARVGIYLPDKAATAATVYRPLRPPMINDSLYRAEVSEPPRR